MSDPLNNYFGRRGVIFFSAVFCFFSVIGSAVTQNWEQLFVTRLLLGIGMGSKASTGASISNFLFFCQIYKETGGVCYVNE